MSNVFRRTKAKFSDGPFNGQVRSVAQMKKVIDVWDEPLTNPDIPMHGTYSLAVGMQGDSAWYEWEGWDEYPGDVHEAALRKIADLFGEETLAGKIARKALS